MPQSITPGVSDIAGDRGGLYPRWLVLALVIATPLMVVSYLAETLGLFNRISCRLAICQIDTLPSVLQIILLWLAFIVIWALAFLLGFGPLETYLELPDSDQQMEPTNETVRFLWHATNFSRMRNLLAIYGMLALALFIVMLVRGHFAPTVFAVAVIFVFVVFTTWFWKPNAERREHSKQVRLQYLDDLSNPKQLIRALPLLRHFLPPALTARPMPPAPGVQQI